MNTIILVKYVVANSSVHRTEPKKINVWFRSYDLLAAEEKILFPKCVVPITIELKMEIPHGYFGKIYPRSSILKKYFASCDTGVIDSDFFIHSFSFIHYLFSKKNITRSTSITT